MKRFVMRRLVTALCATGFLGLSTDVLASAFQLWEQGGASTSNYHAGYAALAEDASTAFYNPAGIVRIKNQQIVAGVDSIMSDFKYKGSVRVANIFPRPLPQISRTFPAVTEQGGVYSLVPSFHYVAPINDCLGFGFSIDAPFGLKTNYGRTSPLRYAATLSSITVVDISPSIAYRVTAKGSIGVGLDIQRAYAELDSIALSVITPHSDTQSINKANDTAYGYHAGILYEFTPCTRVGLSYHSQVVHHFTGNSEFSGPIAEAINGGELRSGNAHTNVTLPPWTVLSAYHRFMPSVAVMGSVAYTQWNTFQDLVLQGVAGAVPAPFPFIVAPSRNIVVSIPEHYRNTWNVSVGADYYWNDCVTVRGALGYDQTPLRNSLRDVRLPDNNRYIVALGGRFQATNRVALDVGWSHFFVRQAHINPPPQVLGAQIVSTDGHVTGGADVFYGGIVWNIC